MTKYSPLRDYLEKDGEALIPMSFARIEAIIGDRLPPSARKHRAWWSNNPANSVVTRAWRAAGYRTAEVDLKRERLVFMRLNAAETAEKPRARRGFLGGMKGSVTIAEGHDLTAPLDEVWDAAIR